MKYIKLTKGYEAIVDNKDYNDLIQFKWRVNISKSDNKYAIRSWYDKKTKKILSEKMHRRILKVNNSKIYIDHINHNGLDNRKVNLRIANAFQNARHANKTKKKTTSKYKGVHFIKNFNKWEAKISVNKKLIFLGWFKTEIQAAKKYNIAAKKYHKEYAFINKC